MAREVVERLEALGEECSMAEERCRKMYGDTRYVRFSPQEAQRIVAIGGDGSVLRAAKSAIQWEKPLLGINSGRLGFLCALDADDSEHWTADYMSSLVPAQRTYLSFVLDGQEHHALNDVVVAKEYFGEAMELEVGFCKEQHRFCADGLVIATPTGSTAYNMSAGGAVMHPQVPALVVTPICAHDGRIRSKVIPQDAVVDVKLLRSYGGKASIYVDGEFCGAITDSFCVGAAKKTLTLYTKA